MSHELNLPYPLVRGFVKYVQRPGLGPPLPMRARRRWLEMIAAPSKLSHDSVAEPVTLGDRPALRIDPSEQRSDAALVHLHGGGYTLGSPRIYTGFGAHLAELTARTVYLPDYRLAPEHQYPAALDDALAACRQAADEHGAILLSGDSAGGGLAAAATLKLAGTPAAPQRLGLIAPWVDLTDLPATVKTDIVVRPVWGFRSATQYAGRRDRHDPGISPIYGDLSLLPPTLVHIGAGEVLHRQVVRFVEKARAAGVDIELAEFDRLWHVAHLHAALLREAREMLQAYGEFLR